MIHLPLGMGTAEAITHSGSGVLHCINLILQGLILVAGIESGTFGIQGQFGFIHFFDLVLLQFNPPTSLA